MVEATTGWLETYPVLHATAWNTILGIEKQVLWRHGTPERIELDNGTHFQNNLIDTWVNEHGSEDGDSTTSLGSLLQGLTTLSVKTFFLISSVNLPWCNLRLFSLVPLLVTREKRPTPTLLQPPFRACSLDPSPALLPSSGHAPAPQCLFVVRGPKLNTVFEVQPHTGEGRENIMKGLWVKRRTGRHHRITESQNCIGWKRPLRSSSPTVNLTLPRPPLHHVPKHLIQMSSKYLQGWRLNHFPGQPVPMLDNPFSEVKFPNIQSKPPLPQLEAISSHPITCYLGEETDPHLSTPSFQVAGESNKVSPQPPFLQAKQSQLPQLLLIRLILHQLHCPSLDTLQHLNVSLVVRGPKLNTVFEGHDHFPSPAGHTIFDTSQDAIGFLGHLGTLLAHIQLTPLFPKPVALHGVAVAQVQDLAHSLVEPHTIDLGPSILPVQSFPLLKQINTPTQLGVICKLTEGALDPLVQIIDKDIKQNWPQHRALGNTACDRPPTGVNSIHHHSLGLAIQPVLNPVKSTPVQAMSSQFLQENGVGNRVKGFTEV
ncbi:LOW QUALITY PROTEIN: hypothetical protein QYF61_022806 [Mycteria americana]|uniref:Integrase catalytic domain-containing protein n=1 Tax=Mycteria americana TaxID=33587 RepID=A0AAN7NM49_MYCAM|nr:LOW QUALITY PROTEIN: hypothetical protein QYF61_022806 [Mycteria americana]